MVQIDPEVDLEVQQDPEVLLIVHDQKVDHVIAEADQEVDQDHATAEVEADQEAVQSLIKVEAAREVPRSPIKVAQEVLNREKVENPMPQIVQVVQNILQNPINLVPHRNQLILERESVVFCLIPTLKEEISNHHKSEIN